MKRRYAGLAIVSLAMLGCESNQPAEAPYAWHQDRPSARDDAFARVNRQMPGHVLGCDSPYYRPWVAYMPQPAEWVPPTDADVMDPEAAARAETASEPMPADQPMATDEPMAVEESATADQPTYEAPAAAGTASMTYDESASTHQHVEPAAETEGEWTHDGGDWSGDGMNTRSKIVGRKPFVPRSTAWSSGPARWDEAESGETTEPVEVQYDEMEPAAEEPGAMILPAPAAEPVAYTPPAEPAPAPAAQASASAESAHVSYAAAAPRQTSTLADESAMAAVEPAAEPATEAAPADYDNAFVINEAQEPQAFPEAGPEGEIVEKQYPAFRAAQVWAADVKDASQNEMFKVLYDHIKTNEIEMTSPVIIFYSEYTKGDPIADRLAFVYGDPNIEASTVGDKVEVIDVQGQTVLSVGVRGSYSSKRFKSELAKLHDFVDANPGYEVAGAPRYMTYNSPFVPFFLKYGEVQLPVKAK